MALAEAVAPLARELCFQCFKRSETLFFPASLFKGLSETMFSTFWRIFGSAGEAIGATLGTSGRLFSEGIFDDFGCQNDGFLGVPAPQGMVPVGAGGLARERN